MLENTPQEVQKQTLPIGRIGNPERMDHHELFGRLDFQGHQ